MSATDTAYVPQLGVLVVEEVTANSLVITRLKYRLSAQNPEVHRYKTLAIRDGHGVKSLIVEGALTGMVTGELRAWEASDTEVVQFYRDWSDSMLTLDSWLELVKAEPWLNQDEKERLVKLYAAYMRESAR